MCVCALHKFFAVDVFGSETWHSILSTYEFIQKYIKMQFIHVINWIHLFYSFIIIIYIIIYLYYFIIINLPLRYIYIEKRWSTQNWSSVIIYSTSCNLFHKSVCICYFCWIKKGDIVKNNQTFLVPIDFYCMDKKYNGNQWEPKQHFSKHSFLFFFKSYRFGMKWHEGD